jgi:hypothetical protein
VVNRYKIMKWQDLPKEIQEKMLERQEEQTGKRDASVFEKIITSAKAIGGIDWDETPENCYFWYEILINDNISHFYTISHKKEIPYPKVMMVSDYRFDNYNKGKKAVVFMEKCERYICWDCDTIEKSENEVYPIVRKYAKDIEPIPSYTMEELFEKLGEKFTIKD